MTYIMASAKEQKHPIWDFITPEKDIRKIASRRYTKVVTCDNVTCFISFDMFVGFSAILHENLTSEVNTSGRLDLVRETLTSICSTLTGAELALVSDILESKQCTIYGKSWGTNHIRIIPCLTFCNSMHFPHWFVDCFVSIVMKSGNLAVCEDWISLGENLPVVYDAAARYIVDIPDREARMKLVNNIQHPGILRAIVRRVFTW